jgi:hypothetical protein
MYENVVLCTVHFLFIIDISKCGSAIFVFSLSKMPHAFLYSFEKIDYKFSFVLNRLWWFIIDQAKMAFYNCIEIETLL